MPNRYDHETRDGSVLARVSNSLAVWSKTVQFLWGDRCSRRVQVWWVRRSARASRTNDRPIPSNQASLASAVLSWVGRRLPCCRMPGVRRYKPSNPPREPGQRRPGQPGRDHGHEKGPPA